MDKDGSATHRRHRPGPGAPPMGVGPAHLKAASEMAELQRSRSVGGLLQKGDPPSCIKKLCKELESEDPGKDVRSEAEDASCQASLEDKQDRGQDARGQALEDANVEEASTRHKQPAGGEGADECAPEDEELEPKSVKLDDLLEKEARESRFSGRIRRGGRGRGSAVDAGQSPRWSWACGLDRPQAPLAPGLCSALGRLNPSSQNSTVLREQGVLTEAPSAQPCRGDPARPAAWGTALPGRRPPPRRGLPSSPCSWGWRGARQLCQGLHRRPWACVQGFWGSLHSQKHFSQCQPRRYHRKHFQG
uniref:Uncharacterized protein n=1 Tax=Bos mutus grunniens TaxID=30521 RepID=A0A8C0AEP6_BOSMU